MEHNKGATFRLFYTVRILKAEFIFGNSSKVDGIAIGRGSAASVTHARIKLDALAVSSV